MAQSKFIHDMPLLAEACRKALAETPQGTAPNFDTVFHADVTKSASRSGAGCLWFKLEATDSQGKRGPFNWRGQVTLVGGINAATADGLAKVNAARAKYGIQGKSKVREDEPKLVIGYYETAPKTVEGDDLVIDTNEPLPPISDVGLVYHCLNTWFVMKLAVLKRQGLITDSAVGAPAEALIVANAKIFPPMQTHIAQGRPNAGRELPNALSRLRIKIDKVAATLTDTMLYDQDKPYTDANGNKLFDLMQTDDGQPITNLNIHEVIRTGSKATLIVKADSICSHSIGISIPTSVEVAIVKKPVRQAKAGIADLAGMVAGLNITAPVAAAPVAAAPVAAAPIAAAPIAAAPIAAAPIAAAPIAAAPVAAAPVAAAPVDPAAAMQQQLAISTGDMDALLAQVAQ